VAAARDALDTGTQLRRDSHMASYRGHLMFASVLGGAYGAAGLWRFDFDWGPVCLAAGLTTVGGLAPDLDSDSSVPVRELFSLVAVVVPFLLFNRLADRHHLSPERTLVILGVLYVVIRYGVSRVFKRYTVHRGMFHSIPGMLIAGLAVYLLYHSPDFWQRVYLAGSDAGVLVAPGAGRDLQRRFHGPARSSQPVLRQRAEIHVALGHGDRRGIRHLGGVERRDVDRCAAELASRTLSWWRDCRKAPRQAVIRSGMDGVE
jgi:hypothetical protein